MNSQLTVVVPLYNQEKYIRQCIESILHQSLYDVNVIVVNDGSTDHSLEICNDIAQTDSRVMVLSQKNQGSAEARLTGIIHATTKYVTFVDADDFILHDSYINAVEWMDDDNDVILFEIERYYNEHNIKHEYHVLESGKYDKKRISEEVYPKLVWNFEKKTPGLECSLCVRIVKTELLREAYYNLNGNRFYYGEDIAISYPLTTRINSMVVIPKSYYMHRQRENSKVPGYVQSEGYFEEVRNLCNYIRYALSKNVEGYNFCAQIDYFYMYSVELKKLCYNDYFYFREFLFPFNCVGYGEKILLYGAGEVGNVYYNQISKIHYCDEVIWVDKNAKYIYDSRVKGLEVLNKKNTQNVNHVVIAIENRNKCEQIKKELVSKGFDENIIVY